MRRQRATLSLACCHFWCQLILWMVCLGPLLCQNVEAFGGHVRLSPHRSIQQFRAASDQLLSFPTTFSFSTRRRQPSDQFLEHRRRTSLAVVNDDVSSISMSAEESNSSRNTTSGSGAIVKETQLHRRSPPSSQHALKSPLIDSSIHPAVVAAQGNNATEDMYTQAIERTLLWVGAAILFGIGLWVMAGPTTAAEFFAGYLVEQSLSLDNLFVFLVLFEYFRVPLSGQNRVLTWGIYGAVFMRAIMIGLGAAALQHFRELLLLFAAILIYSSANNLISLASVGPQEGDEDEDLSQNAIVKFSKSLIPSTDRFDGDNFFTLVNGIKTATPLFICMVAVEVSDVVFAVDSIPAVFGVTENPLVVFTSNMFAIMGLRSLFTILSKAATDLKYLEPAVAVVLGFIGGKMVAEYLGYHIPTEVALSVVTSMLATGVGASVWEQRQQQQQQQQEDDARCDGHEELLQDDS